MKFKIFQPQAIHERGSRPNQEDSIFPALNTATVNDRLFILCDGMGGHESGEVASGTVCETMSSFINNNLGPDQVLDDALVEQAVDAAYAAVNAKDTAGMKKMGTTLTFLCLHKGGCTVAHIGDSRIYHLRPSTNEILYRSRDHSLVYDLFEVGEMTFDEMKTAKNKNVITRVIMANQERQSKADIVHITNIKPGDYFYLCSDGMLEQMEDQELLDIFASDRTDEQKRKMLVGQTIDNSDNHSAYIIRIESVEQEVGDETLYEDEAAARAANKVLMAELDPSSITVAPPPPPIAAPTPAPEYSPEVSMAEPEDDVQIVNQPVQPHVSYQQAPSPTYGPSKKGNNGMLKWGIIAALLMAILTAAIVLFFVLKKNDKPEQQNVAFPTSTETPVKPDRHQDQYDNSEEAVEDHSHYYDQRNNSGNHVNTGRVNNTGTRVNQNQNQGSRRTITTDDANGIVGGKRGVKPTQTDPERKIDGTINSGGDPNATQGGNVDPSKRRLNPNFTENSSSDDKHTDD